MASSFEMTKVKLDLLADFDMLLMVEKGVRGGVCHTIHQYAKANYKYMRDFDKNKELPDRKYYWDINDLYGWVISQMLLANGFKWLKLIQNLMKILWRAIIMKVMKDIFLKLMFNILKIP